MILLRRYYVLTVHCPDLIQSVELESFWLKFASKTWNQYIPAHPRVTTDKERRLKLFGERGRKIDCEKMERNVLLEEKRTLNLTSNDLVVVLTGLRDGWATCRPIRVTASGRAGGRRAQGAFGDAAPLGQHRRGGGSGDGAGWRARAEPVEAVKRMKAMEAGLVRQLLEPPSQEPVLARQLFLVYGVLTLAILQVL